MAHLKRALLLLTVTSVALVSAAAASAGRTTDPRVCHGVSGPSVAPSYCVARNAATLVCRWWWTRYHPENTQMPKRCPATLPYGLGPFQVSPTSIYGWRFDFNHGTATQPSDFYVVVRYRATHAGWYVTMTVHLPPGE